MDGTVSSKRQVVLVGMCQSGGMSLSAAILSLGYRTMGFHRPAMARAVRGNFDLFDKNVAYWEQLRDYPFNTFYGRIAERRPDARFVLTYRKDLDHWFDKLAAYSREKKIHAKAHQYWWGQPYLEESNREHCKDVHKRHCDKVRATLAGRELLEWTVDDHDGWPTICDFLGEPVPAFDFPVTDVRQDFISYHAKRLDKSWMVWESLNPVL